MRQHHNSISGIVGFNSTGEGGGSSSPFLVNPTMIVPAANEPCFEKYDELRLHMQAIYSSHLIDWDIPLRVLLPLERAGIVKVGDLLRLDIDALQRIPRIGIKAAKALERKARRFDLTLGECK